jgi:hypothetical protein
MGRYRHSGDPAWESADGDPEGYGDPPTPSARKAARTERIIAARAARAKEEANRKLHATLGDELTAALLRYLAGKPAAETMPLERAMAMIGYSDELKKLLVRCIEVNPAMEESFLLIAELAYADGREEEIDRGFEYYE